jgi:hypothetical protein
MTPSVRSTETEIIMDGYELKVGNERSTCRIPSHCIISLSGSHQSNSTDMGINMSTTRCHPKHTTNANTLGRSTRPVIYEGYLQIARYD